MILLKETMVLPSVTTSQVLLRRHRPHTTITCDGIYGPKTKGAVRNFQSAHSLDVDGTIGRYTWTRFMQVAALKTIDVVDAGDPAIDEFYSADLRASGADPIVVYGMSNGVPYAIDRIIARAAGAGRIAILRINGHGGSGLQNVTGGKIDGARHMAGISNGNIAYLTPALSRLQPYFATFGSAELLGCEVAHGSSGLLLLQRLANIWGVPVTAGTKIQTGTFSFTGPTRSAFPGGGTVKSWSSVQQEVAGNLTVPL